MRNFVLVSASLLCSLFWIFVSVSESHSVEVQSGEEVTLMCSNYSASHSAITWFKINRSEPRCLSHMFQSDKPATFCSGFQKGKFEMTSNSSALFLNIKPVDSSDAGLYFCGYTMGKNHVMAEATFLEVQDVKFGLTTLLSIVCAGLTVLFISVITCLAVRLIKLQRARIEEQNPQQGQSPDSEEVNYATVTFRPKAERNLRPALD